MFNAIGSRLKDTAIAVKDGAIIAAVATKDAAVYTAEVSYDAGVATAAAVNVAVVEPAKEELRVVWEKIDTNTPQFVIESDATIVLPLLLASLE